MASPNLNKLFSELLVSKNRLSILRSYYTGIKDSIVDKLTDLYNDLVADVDWVDRKISDLAVDKSDALTTMSKFVSNTEDSLIVNHEKYQEMMTAYNSHIKDFYERMTNLYPTYEQNFRENEISKISTEWKFYYSTNYSDAQSVEHSFGPLNFTSESDIFELSNNRFIYMTNENVVYDVDYVNKTVYLVVIDSKTFDNQDVQKNTKSIYIGNERASFNTLFRLHGRSNIYALVNVGSAFAQDELNKIYDTAERTSALVGPAGDTSPIQKLIVCKYDHQNHRFEILPEQSTSRIFIKGSVLKENKITFIDGTTNDYFYYYVGPHLVRVKIEAANLSNITQKCLGTSSINIVGAVLDSTGRISIPISETTIGVYDAISSNIDFSGAGALKKFTFDALKAQFAPGEEGKIQALFHSTDISGNGKEAIYAVTDKSIWYTTDRFTTVIKDTRTNSISITNLTFTNKDEYLIDEFGYIYVLGDNARLYCAKTIDGTTLEGIVVESPTRYADKIVNISSLIKSNLAGYIYALDPSITKYQNTDEGGESFIYSYTNDEYDDTYDSNGILLDSVFKNSTWYGITTTGKVVCYDIDAEGSSESTKKHLWTKQSICDNKTITAITYDETSKTFFFATEDYNVYYITKSNMESERTTSNTVARQLGTVITGSKITALIKIDDVIYLGCRSGEIHCYVTDIVGNGVIKGEFHTASITLKEYYNEDDAEKFHINDGKAIGNSPVKQLLTDGSCMIVLGGYGRVASCALNSNIWTNYKGESTNAAEIDSIIYCDGEALNRKDIVCGINYSNSKLIVIAEGGYIASCNLVTGNWSRFDGTLESHGQNGVGPGIYNDGTILGGLNPTCCTRIGTTLFVAGEHGRMGSINILTGGLTEYRGTSPKKSELSGPGYYYTGSDLASMNDVTSVTTDSYAGIVILCGTESFILSYSPSANEVLTPTVDKLYYIARRQSDYDYLSALLVRVTKGSLNEYAPLYPPQEKESNFEMAYESSYYVYQNGMYVWRVSTGFDKVYFSKDNGITYERMDIRNSEILPAISTNTIRYMPMGYVAKDGTFLFVDNIAGSSFFIFGTQDENGFDACWKESRHLFTQKELNTLECVENGKDFRFVIDIGNGLSNISLNERGSELSNSGVTSVCISDDGFEYELINDQLCKEKEPIFNAKNIIKSYLAAVLNISDEFTIPKLYYTVGNNFTFVVNLSTRLILVTINFVEISEGLVEDNYSISSKVLTLNELRLENAKNIYTENYGKDVTTIKIDEESMYLVTDYTGVRGFLGFNVEITSNNYTSTDKRNVLISLKGDVFGTNYINESAVFNIGDSAARLVCFDRDKCEVQLAYYNTLDQNKIIKHTNSIHRFRSVESVSYTPIRALTDAWKSCEIKMSSKDINAFAIRLKMRNTEEDTEEVAIAKQFTLRYQVLISDVTNGKYILYETEKSTGISKTDDETKVVEPFIRVIAIDGFEDEIMELYTSRRDSTRRSIFTKKEFDGGTNNVGSFNSRIETTYDFATYVQRRSNVVKNVNTGVRYQIKIKPLNTLPSNVDAEFFIEPYNNSTLSNASITSRALITNPIKDYVNNIDKSEFKLALAEVDSGIGFAFGIPNYNGFLTKTQMDIGHMTKKPYVSNCDHLPQYDERDYDISIGKADTYVNIIRGEGNGLYDKLSGIITNTGENKWKVVPFAVNKEDLRYSFDEDSSAIINANMDTKLLKNGRNLYKMRNFSIFSKGVTNDVDFYTDYENTGRIVKVEGSMVNPNGLHEVISSIDGHQKRINPVSESRIGEIWRTTANAFEYIKRREYGKSYDIVDRFSMFEDPYYAVQAWWIPAQGYVTKGNERFLSLGFDETANSNGLVGRRYLPHDSIVPASVVEKTYSGNVNNIINGVVSTTSGKSTYDTNKEIAVKELVDEKFPLERWNGFEWADLCFIRKWQTTYTDDSIEYLYEIESPMIENTADPTKPKLGLIYTLNHIPIPGSSSYNTIPEKIRSPKPTIPRNLYSYWDDFDWEGRGKQILKCASAYYYTTHDWKIYHHEVQETVYDWSDEQKLAAKSTSTIKSFYDSEGNLLNEPVEIEGSTTMESIVEDNNYARNNIVSQEITEDKWYVPVTNNVNIASINHNNERYHEDYPFTNTIKPSDKDDRGIPEFDNFPRPKNQVVAERIINLYTPVADMVYEHNIASPYKTLEHDNRDTIDGRARFYTFRRGNVLQESESYVPNVSSEATNSWIKMRHGKNSENYRSFDNIFGNEFTNTNAIELGVFNGDDEVKVRNVYSRLVDNNDDIVKIDTGLISIYGSVENVADKEDDKYVYRKHIHSSDVDYGLNGYSNPVGNISFVQNGYHSSNNKVSADKFWFRGISDTNDGNVRGGNYFYDVKNSIVLRDDDFILDYKQYLGKADGDRNVNFGIMTTDFSSNLSKITKVQGTPTYERYCGGSSFKYLYARDIDVTVDLVYRYNGYTSSNDKSIHGGNPYSNKYIKHFGVEALGEGTFSTYRGKRITSTAIGDDPKPTFYTSRHGFRGLTASEEIVDKSFIGFDYPTRPEDIEFSRDTDSYIEKNYNFWEFRNNGRRVKRTETYRNKYRWIRVFLDPDLIDDLGSNIDNYGRKLLNPTDTSGDGYKSSYSIKCLECYEWVDGSVMEYKTEHTVEELIRDWGLTIVRSPIEIGHNDSSYTVKVSVTLSGLNIVSEQFTGEVQSVTISSVNEVTYAQSEDIMGDADAANVITWQNDENVPGNGNNDDTSGAEVGLTFNLNRIDCVNDTIPVPKRNEPLVLYFEIPEEDRDMYNIEQGSIRVTLGTSPDVLSSNYCSLQLDKYRVDPDDETSQIKCYRATLTINTGVITDDVHIEGGAVRDSSKITIGYNLDGISSSNTDTVITSRTMYETTLTADEGLFLPDEVTVYVGGIATSYGVTYDKSTGGLIIEDQTTVSDIIIEAKAEQPISIEKNFVGVTCDYDMDVASANSDFRTIIIADEGHSLPPNVSISVNRIDVTDECEYNKLTGEIYIPKDIVTGTITITARGIPLENEDEESETPNDEEETE